MLKIDQDINKLSLAKKENPSEETIKELESLRLVKSGLKCSLLFAYERLGRDYLKLAEFQVFFNLFFILPILIAKRRPIRKILAEGSECA